MSAATKQKVINFIENRPTVSFDYYEDENYNNVIITAAASFAIESIVEDLKKEKYIRMHVASFTGNLELFIDKDSL
jgi:hypothetical protein